jgi:hypothetical protein
MLQLHCVARKMNLEKLKVICKICVGLCLAYSVIVFIFKCPM